MIDARIRRTVAAKRKDTVALAYDLAAMDQDRRWSAYDFTSLAHYARDRGVDYSASQVRQLVALVRSLERLPRARKAFRAGLAGWTLFRELARYATPDNEEELLADMLVMTSEQFMERLRRLRGAPDRRKITIEVTPEERDVILAAAAAARTDDQGMTLGQAIARACKAYVQSSADQVRAPGPPSPEQTRPVEVARPLAAAPVVTSAFPRTAVIEGTPVEATAGANDQQPSSMEVVGDGPDLPLAGPDLPLGAPDLPLVGQFRHATRDDRLIVELDRSGLSVRRVDGSVLGSVSFDVAPPPGRAALVVATPEELTTPAAGTRAG